MGAFIAFLLLAWGVLIVMEQHSSTSNDVVLEGLGGIFIAVGLTFFWAIRRFKKSN